MPTPAAARLATSLAGDAAWIFAGNAGYSAAQWAVVVVLARFGSTTMVGQYALALAIGAPVVLLCGLSLRTAQVTAEPGARGFETYRRVRLVSMLVALAIVTTVAAAVGSTTGAVIALVGLAKAVDGLADIYHGQFQRSAAMRPIGISMLSNGAATLACTATLLVATGSIAWAAAGSVIGSVGALVWVCRPAAARLRLAGSAGPPAHIAVAAPPAALGLVRVALPLGLAASLTSFAISTPSYLLDGWYDRATLGIFAALTYLSLSVAPFVSAVAQAVLPRLAHLRQRGDLAGLRIVIGRLVAVTALAGVVLVLAAALLGRPVLRLLYGEEYARHHAVLTVLMAAAAVGALVFFVDAALSAARRFDEQLVGSILALAAAAAAVPLIATWGMMGAAWTAVAVGAVPLAVKTALLYRFLDHAGADERA